ncbi:hypothetical protein PPACK8108_LOCUS15918 [Phakopsora pachyrhizi]|uniref:Uncharacterized protein n=1 Tax=Phakopsora pachyrhizi TaxID=170000 RepID=A0AAV0BAL2_PHAPC|nr:hypothetical protein PPACK8108_LOCUS15918 [Phakopsora pachyrhizi]
MRSFVTCALLILFFQLIVSSPIEQSSEKQIRRPPPPPPPPVRRPPPPPHSGRPHPRDTGNKDNHQNEKRYGVEASQEQLSEKLIRRIASPQRPPVRRPPPPPSPGRPRPRDTGNKDNHQNEKRYGVEASQEQLSEKLIRRIASPQRPPVRRPTPPPPSGRPRQ